MIFLLDFQCSTLFFPPFRSPAYVYFRFSFHATGGPSPLLALLSCISNHPSTLCFTSIFIILILWFVACGGVGCQWRDPFPTPCQLPLLKGRLSNYPSPIEPDRPGSNPSHLVPPRLHVVAHDHGRGDGGKTSDLHRHGDAKGATTDVEWWHGWT